MTQVQTATPPAGQGRTWQPVGVHDHRGAPIPSSADFFVPPPPEIRQRVEDKLRDVPALPHQAKRQYRRHGTEYVEVKETSEHIRVHKIWRKLFIALVVLAKILLALAIFYFLEYRHAEKQINRLSSPVERGAAPGVR